MHFYFKTPPVPHIPLVAQQTHKHVRHCSDKPTIYDSQFRKGSQSMIQALDSGKWWTQAALTQGKSVWYQFDVEYMFTLFYVHVAVHRNKFLYNKTN